MHCPLKVNWVRIEMLECNETKLTACLKDYKDFVKLYNWCTSPELVFSINEINIEKEIQN